MFAAVTARAQERLPVGKRSKSGRKTHKNGSATIMYRIEVVKPPWYKSTASIDSE